jgi:adenylate cyclase
MGNDAEAELGFKKALQLNPDLYDALYFYGRLLFPQKRWTDVIAQWERAIVVDPEEYQCSCLIVAAYRDLGWTPEQRKQILERARQRTLSYVTRHPESPRAYYLGSGVYFELGERAEGMRWVDKALRVDPLDPGVHYNVACTLAVAGETERALDHVERAMELGFAGMKWLSNDPDLVSIRDHPRFKKAIKKALD